MFMLHPLEMHVILLSGGELIICKDRSKVANDLSPAYNTLYF